MVRSFCQRCFVIFAGLFLSSLVAAALAAESPRRPRIPEPLSPILPPDVRGAPQRGDSQRGERIYQSLGCPTCHTLDGKGGKLGPDLYRTAEVHTDSYWFRRYLSEPRSIIPNSVKPPVRISDAEMDDLIAYLLTLKKFR